MARTTPRPRPTATQTLTPLTRSCPTCGNTMWAAYHNYRTIPHRTDVLRLTLEIRHGLPGWSAGSAPLSSPSSRSPRAAQARVWPQFIALVGPRRHAQPRREPNPSGVGPAPSRRWRPARSCLSWSARMHSSHARWRIRAGSSGCPKDSR